MKIAAVDIGLKRIGVAFCFDNSTVIPQNAIIRRGRKQAANDLTNLIKEWQIDRLIVGLPKGYDNEDEMDRRIRHFISLLDIDIDIVYIDESYTSFEAKEQIKGIIKQKRDGRIDSISAKIILERWLVSFNTI